MTHTNKSVFSYDASDVWTASCAAYRINDGYIKNVPYPDPDGVKKTTNRDLLVSLLKDPAGIIENDRIQADKIRTFFKGYTFKVLSGEKLSDFDIGAMTIANRDKIEKIFDLAIIASLPSVYNKALKRKEIDNRINNASGGFIGKIKDRVEVSIEVLKSIYSANWNTYYVTGVTDADEIVFFPYRENLEVGSEIKLSGTVKSHRENSTQLNRVKILDKGD